MMAISRIMRASRNTERHCNTPLEQEEGKSENNVLEHEPGVDEQVEAWLVVVAGSEAGSERECLSEIDDEISLTGDEFGRGEHVGDTAAV